MAAPRSTPPLEGADAADDWLSAKGVDFTLVVQNTATGKCRDSAAERGISLRQIVKSMVFASHSEEYLQCLVPGHLSVDTGKLEALVGEGCRMLEEEELLRVTGKPVGCVHPFVPGVSRRFLDKRVGKDEGGVVSFNTGDQSRGLLLPLDGLVRALEGQHTVENVAMADEGEDAEDLAADLGIARHDARFLLDSPDDRVPYYMAYKPHCPAQAPDCFPGSDDATHHLYWLRLLCRHAQSAGRSIDTVAPAWLGELASAGGATKYAREQALKAYLEGGEAPKVPEEAGGLGGEELAAVVDAVVAEESKSVDKMGGDAKARAKLLGYLMGCVMKKTAGKADPKEVRESLSAALSKLLG